MRVNCLSMSSNTSCLFGNHFDWLYRCCAFVSRLCIVFCFSMAVLNFWMICLELLAMILTVGGIGVFSVAPTIELLHQGRQKYLCGWTIRMAPQRMVQFLTFVHDELNLYFQTQNQCILYLLYVLQGDVLTIYRFH
jgi:hypothetical protein